MTHLPYGLLQPVIAMPAGQITLSILGEISRLPAVAAVAAVAVVAVVAVFVIVVAEVLAPPNVPLLDLPDLFSKRPKSRKLVHCCWQHSTEFVAFCQSLAERLIEE